MHFTIDDFVSDGNKISSQLYTTLQGRFYVERPYIIK